jgi:DNA replication and repair protein RecF
MKVIYSKRLIAALQENINKDRALQYTSVGTIKTTCRLKSTDTPLKNLASGATKNLLIALKLAQFEFLKQSGKSLFYCLMTFLQIRRKPRWENN